MLTIGSGDNLESNTYSAFRFVTTEHHNKHALFGLEKNPSNFSSDEAHYPYGDGVTLRDWGWWNYHTEKDDVLYSGKDVPFTLTLTPDTNDSNYYDAQIKIGANDDYVGTRKIPASEVTAFDRLTITLKQFQTATTANYVGLKDLKITTSSVVPKTALVEGENTIYLPVENVTGHEVDFAIVAAVCDKETDQQLGYSVATYNGHQKRFDNLEVKGVNITNPLNQYVKLFVFNTFGNLMPYTTPISNQ